MDTKQDESYFDKDFDNTVRAALNEYHVPGLSVAIVDGDKVATKVGIDLSIYK